MRVQILSSLSVLQGSDRRETVRMDCKEAERTGYISGFNTKNNLPKQAAD